ncbi:MAG: sugar phosphate isomerase/epimerase family protein [Planctomycetaceae bacterium]
MSSPAPSVSRRGFLGATALTTAAAFLPGLGSRSAFAVEPQDGPLFRISLAEWSLHKTIFDKKLDHLDFAKVAKEEFDIDGIEYVNQFFFDKAQDKEYLGQMKQRAEDHGVKSLLIMCDREGNLGDPDKAKRMQAVENHKKWVEAAAFLGCHSIRVNAASGGTYDEQIELAADGLLQLTIFAEQFNLSVLVENHGGLSSNGEWLSAVMRKVDHPHCGTLPDFGNFAINRKEGEWYDRYKGLEELMPFAQAVSAKSHDFNEDQPLVTFDRGGEKETDFLKAMQIVLNAGYRGYVGIEYEGRELDEYAGIRRTREMLIACREKLSQA